MSGYFLKCLQFLLFPNIIKETKKALSLGLHPRRALYLTSYFTTAPFHNPLKTFLRSLYFTMTQQTKEDQLFVISHNK